MMLRNILVSSTVFLVLLNANRAQAATLPISSKLVCDNTSPGYPAIFEKKGSKLSAITFSAALKNQDKAIKKAKSNLSKLKKQKAKKSKIAAATKARDAALKVKADIKACQQETFIPRPVIPGPACTQPALTARAPEDCPQSFATGGLNLKLVPKGELSASDLARKQRREASGLYGLTCAYSADGKTNILFVHETYYALNINYETEPSTDRWALGICNPKASGSGEGPTSGFGHLVLYPVTHQIYIYVYGKLPVESRAAVANDFAEYFKQFALPCSCKKKIYGYD